MLTRCWVKKLVEEMHVREGIFNSSFLFFSFLLSENSKLLPHNEPREGNKYAHSRGDDETSSSSTR